MEREDIHDRIVVNHGYIYDDRVVVNVTTVSDYHGLTVTHRSNLQVLNL